MNAFLLNQEPYCCRRLSLGQMLADLWDNAKQISTSIGKVFHHNNLCDFLLKATKLTTAGRTASFHLQKYLILFSSILECGGHGYADWEVLNNQQKLLSILQTHAFSSLFQLFLPLKLKLFLWRKQHIVTNVKVDRMHILNTGSN